jgi:hypothetical protein
MLGSEQQAGNYELVLNLNAHDNRGEGLSFWCRALSLCSASWTRAGIVLTASSLRENFAAELELGITIKMEAEVKDTSAEHRLQ